MSTKTTARLIDPADLVCTEQIAERLSVHPTTVSNWQGRSSLAQFPAPVFAYKRVKVWAWQDIEEWRESTGLGYGRQQREVDE